MKKYAQVDNCIIDVKADCIIVYLCDQNVDALMDCISLAQGAELARMKAALMQSLSYELTSHIALCVGN